MNRPDKTRLREAHRPRWITFRKWLGFLAAFLLLQGLLYVALTSGPPWTVVPLVLLLGHLMHGHLLAFHEASHGILCPSRTLNEIVGVLIGTLGFTSLSLFRAVHRTHHLHLATERDEELWPFVVPAIPRWQRRIAAMLELTVGLVYTPCLLLRCFLRRESPIRDGAERRRIWAELALTAGFWTGAAVVAAWVGGGWFLLLAYVVPAFLAANLQSWRKFIEHMGLTGPGVLGVTRSVVPPGPVGRMVAFTMFNEPYHGVHHKYPRLPDEQLPDFTVVLVPQAEEDVAPYASYWQALGPTLRCLADPRIGTQWLRTAGIQTESWARRGDETA